MIGDLEFTLKEVAALARTSEKAIRNEMAHGIATARVERRGRSVRRVFAPGAVYYFSLVRRLSLPVPARERRDLYRLLTGTEKSVGRWRRTSNALVHADIVSVDTKSFEREFK